MASAAAVIRMVKLLEALPCAESLTVTWNVKEPAVVGVPEMFPEEAMVNPPGKVPPDTCQVYGGDPPVAAKVCE
jgi:hypothetical protein